MRDIDTLIEADDRAGETTSVIITVAADGISGASVGDSSAWLITAEGYDDLTHGQERKPLVGSGMAWPVGFQRQTFDGTLLVATDGLTQYAPAPNICTVALEADLQAAALSLIDLVRPPLGKLDDDVTVVLCRN